MGDQKFLAPVFNAVEDCDTFDKGAPVMIEAAKVAYLAKVEALAASAAAGDKAGVESASESIGQLGEELVSLADAVVASKAFRASLPA